MLPTMLSEKLRKTRVGGNKWIIIKKKPQQVLSVPLSKVNMADFYITSALGCWWMQRNVDLRVLSSTLENSSQKCFLFLFVLTATAHERSNYLKFLLLHIQAENTSFPSLAQRAAAAFKIHVVVSGVRLILSSQDSKPWLYLSSCTNGMFFVLFCFSFLLNVVITKSNRSCFLSTHLRERLGCSVLYIVSTNLPHSFW